MPTMPRSAQIDVCSVSMSRIPWSPNRGSDTVSIRGSTINALALRKITNKGRGCGHIHEAQQLSSSARVVFDWTDEQISRTHTPLHYRATDIYGQTAHERLAIAHGRTTGTTYSINSAATFRARYPISPRRRCGGRNPPPWIGGSTVRRYTPQTRVAGFRGRLGIGDRVPHFGSWTPHGFTEDRWSGTGHLVMYEKHSSCRDPFGSYVADNIIDYTHTREWRDGLTGATTLAPTKRP